MIIQRRLKYIKFHWDDDTCELTIFTYPKDENDYNIGVRDYETGEMLSGHIKLGKTYLFSTLRFMIRIAQRMWLRRKIK